MMPRRRRADAARITVLTRVLVAVHVLFQLFQHGEALAGGIQLPAQLLLGGISLAEGGFRGP